MYRDSRYAMASNKDRYHRFIPYLFFLFLINTPLSGQPVTQVLTPENKFIIDEILIIGNNSTKDYIILREIIIQPGEIISIDHINFAKKRLENLLLFNRVEIKTETIDTKTTLIIEVTERWYWLPLPILFLNDRTWSRLSYGAGLVHTNFRGRNETFAGSFWLGYNPGFRLYYNNPWISGKNQISLGFSLFQTNTKNLTTVNPFTNFEDQRYGVEIRGGKRFGLYTHFTLRMRYREIHPIDSKIANQVTLSNTDKDRLPEISVSLQYDNRDLKIYPHKGINSRIQYRKIGWSQINADYGFINTDIRWYIPLPKNITVAFRAFSNFSHGTIPLYDRLFMGYSERVRGHFHDEKDEGEHRLGSSVELRFPILDVNYFTWDDAPDFLKLFYTNLPFGINGVFFMDIGKIWFQNQNFNSKNYIRGYGLGLHFHVPYIHILRLEMGFDEQNNNEWILEGGIVF